MAKNKLASGSRPLYHPKRFPEKLGTAAFFVPFVWAGLVYAAAWIVGRPVKPSPPETPPVEGANPAPPPS